MTYEPTSSEEGDDKYDSEMEPDPPSGTPKDAQSRRLRALAAAAAVKAVEAKKRSEEAEA